MAHGLEVRRQDGTISLSTEDTITRYIDYFTVGKNTSGSKTYADLVNQDVVAMARNLDGIWFAHYVIVVGNTVHWGRGTIPSDWAVGPSGITVIAVG